MTHRSVTPPAERQVASIIHADLDSFYASVEQRDDPRLAGRCLAVGGGVVLAASYEARRRGVRKAMPVSAARRHCTDLLVVAPRMDAYAEASKATFEVFGEFTPLVEGLSPDEAFLDVAGARRLLGTPVEIGTQLRRRVADQVGLALSVGIARSKFLAKVASAEAKPDGLLEVPVGGELAFLHPLPIDRLWGVGPVTAQKLHDIGIESIGQLASMHETTLIHQLGPAAGRHLKQLAWSQDPRRVTPGRRARSMGAQRALGHRTRTLDQIHRVALELADRVGSRLRGSGQRGATITVRFRFGDYSRITRARTLPTPTDSTAVVHRTATELIDSVLAPTSGPQHSATTVLGERGLTLIGLSISGLGRDAPEQLVFDFPGERSPRNTEAAIDGVRDRFGPGAIKAGSLIGPPPR